MKRISSPLRMLPLAAWLFIYWHSTQFGLAAPGALDPTFGGMGKVTTNFGTGKDQVLSVALQPDGKIVAAGNAFTGGNADFAVARYNIDGTLDPTFNGTGKVTTAFGNGDDLGASVALQSDGKLVVAGSARIGGRAEYALARYNADGSLDASFGNAGTTTTDILSGDDSASGVALQPDGKIVVAGYSYGDGFGTDDISVVRYLTNGRFFAEFRGIGRLSGLV